MRLLPGGDRECLFGRHACLFLYEHYAAGDFGSRGQCRRGDVGGSNFVLFSFTMYRRPVKSDTDCPPAALDSRTFSELCSLYVPRGERHHGSRSRRGSLGANFGCVVFGDGCRVGTGARVRLAPRAPPPRHRCRAGCCGKECCDIGRWGECHDKLPVRSGDGAA